MVVEHNAGTIKIGVKVIDESRKGLQSAEKQVQTLGQKLKKSQFAFLGVGLLFMQVGNIITQAFKGAIDTYTELLGFNNEVGRSVLNLSGNFKVFQVMLAEAFAPVLSDIVDFFIKLMEQFNTMNPQLKKQILTF